MESHLPTSKSEPSLPKLDIPFQLLKPIIRDHPDWKIEMPTLYAHYPDITEFKEIYATDFGTENAHVNFIGIKKGKGHCIVSIKKRPSEHYPKISSLLNLGPSYKALIMDPDGYEEFYLNNIPQKSDRIEYHQALADFLNERTLSKEIFFYPVTQKHFIKDLIALEKKFSRKLVHMKLAVLYIKPGQKNVQEEIFVNHPPEDSRFWTFLSQIANKISLVGWQKYRGDMGISGVDGERESYFTEWRNMQVMLHIAPWMLPEQHRRLVGNDIGVIIFFDNNNPGENTLELFGANDLGIVPHVFGVVEPHPKNNDLYRLAFFNRTNVPSYPPFCPPTDHYFTPNQLKDFLFSKMHNGLVSAQSVSPMNRLFAVPRKEAINELSKKYPKEKLKQIRQREREEARERSQIASTAEKLLKVQLISGKDLSPRDANGLSDPFCILQILDQKYKSSTMRKTLSPHWDMEFYFNIAGINIELEEFLIICMDWDRLGVDVYMGEYRCLIKDLPIDSETPTWFTLYSTKEIEVSGEIQLKFSMVQSLSSPSESDLNTNRTNFAKQRSRAAILTKTLSAANPLKKVHIDRTPMKQKAFHSSTDGSEHISPENSQKKIDYEEQTLDDSKLEGRRDKWEESNTDRSRSRSLEKHRSILTISNQGDIRKATSEQTLTKDKLPSPRRFSTQKRRKVHKTPPLDKSPPFEKNESKVTVEIQVSTASVAQLQQKILSIKFPGEHSNSTLYWRANKSLRTVLEKCCWTRGLEIDDFLALDSQANVLDLDKTLEDYPSLGCIVMNKK